MIASIISIYIFRRTKTFRDGSQPKAIPRREHNREGIKYRGKVAQRLRLAREMAVPRKGATTTMMGSSVNTMIVLQARMRIVLRQNHNIAVMGKVENAANRNMSMEKRSLLSIAANADTELSRSFPGEAA